MVQLHQDYPKFTQHDAEILVIVPDTIQALEWYWRKEEMPMPGLSDQDHQVADRYGQEVRQLKFGRMPALFLVDKAGRLRYAHYGSSMADIPHNSDVLARLRELNSETSAG